MSGSVTTNKRTEKGNVRMKSDFTFIVHLSSSACLIFCSSQFKIHLTWLSGTGSFLCTENANKHILFLVTIKKSFWLSGKSSVGLVIDERAVHQSSYFDNQSISRKSNLEHKYKFYCLLFAYQDWVLSMFGDTEKVFAAKAKAELRFYFRSGSVPPHLSRMDCPKNRC